MSAFLPKLPLRIGELFCGPGGIAYGASCVRTSDGRPAFVHAWANDIDHDTCETFKRNIDGASSDSVICRSVRDLNIGSLGSIDCLAFGFPCNDFSVVGEQLGIHGKYGPLYGYGVEALNTHRPAIFLAENVSGLSSANDGLTLRRILQELGEAGEGYEISAHLYKAEEYNVPQRRRRILIVGIRSDVPATFMVPSPTTASNPPTVKNALVDIPIPSDAKNNELTRQSAQVIERLRHIRPGENAFTANLPEDLTLNVKGATISQIYKRLVLDEPSYTVTGSGGGGTHIYHWEENRALTNRERARLQGFPDHFVFCGSKESVRRQIGMAVPPPLVQAVLQAVVLCLEGIPYKSVSPNIELPSNQLAFVMERRRAYATV